MTLDSKVEALLFFKAEPLSIQELAKLLEVGEGEVRNALSILEERLRSGGVRLLKNGDAVTLGTAPELNALFEEIKKKEFSKDLGKAAIETLSIILYRGPITKSDIDYIRGVNSNFILRNLLIRGLIEREPNPHDQRGFLYRTSFDLMAHLGITKIEELPEYEEVQREFQEFEKSFKEQEQNHGGETTN